MGHCYEFGATIEVGCDHAMRVADSGGACICPTCGAHCTGRYNGCVAILEQGGYVPTTAPTWAIECTEPPARPASIPWRTTPATEDPPEVVDTSPASTRRLADAIGSSLADASQARMVRDIQQATRVMRAELLEAIDGVRREIADRSKELEDGQERRHQDLAGARTHDVEIMRNVVESLARIARRIARVEGALGLEAPIPDRPRQPRK